MNRAQKNSHPLIQARQTVTVFAASLIAIALFGCNSFQGESSDSGAIAANDSQEPLLELESFSPLSGTPHLLAAQVLRPEGSKGSGFSSYDYPEISTHNYLFFDGSTKTSRWLLPNSDSRFLTQQELLQTDPSGKGKVQALIYNQVKADSNDDGQLDSLDAQTLALSDPSGENYQELLVNVENIQQIHQQNNQIVFVFYRMGGQNQVAEIDVQSRKILSRQTLPPTPDA
jgi:hypothetical protein